MTTRNPSQTLLLFCVGPVRLCTDARQVITLVSPPALTRPPGSGASQPGLFRHTSGLVRVIALRERLGIPAESHPELQSDPRHDARIIITRLDTGLTGFQVERILDVIDAPTSGWGVLPPHLPQTLFPRTLLHDGQIYLETDLSRLTGWRDTGALHAVTQIFTAEQLSSDSIPDSRPPPESAPNPAPNLLPEPDSADKTHDMATTLPAGPAVATPPSATARTPAIAATRPAPSPIKASPAASVRTTVRNPKRMSPARPRPRHPSPHYINRADAPEPQTPALASAVPITSHDVAKTAYSATSVTPHTHIATPGGSDTADHKGNPDARMWALAGVVLFALLIGYGGQWVFSSPDEPPLQTHTQPIPRHDRETVAAPVLLAQGQEESATPHPTPALPTMSGQGAPTTPTLTPPETSLPEPHLRITTHHAAASGMTSRQITPPTPSRAPSVRTIPRTAPGPHALVYRHHGELVIVLDDTLATKTSPPRAEHTMTSAPAPLPTHTIGATLMPATAGAVIAPAQSTSHGRNPPAERHRATVAQTPGATTPHGATSPVITTEIVHIVVRGDTLWAIAERYIHDPFRYPELARLSHIRDPNLIYPGDRVHIIYRRHTRVTAGTVSGDNTGH